MALRTESEKANYNSSSAGEGWNRDGGTCQPVRAPVIHGQSALCRLARDWSVLGLGGRRERRIGTWTEPVEGRDEASQDLKAGNMSGLPKARSIALGLCELVKGKRVLVPCVERREKPKLAAWVR